MFCPLDAALAEALGLFGRFGIVKQHDRRQQFIEGRIMFGLQSVKVRLSLVERETGRTTILIQVSLDDVWALAREALQNVWSKDFVIWRIRATNLIAWECTPERSLVA